MFPILIELLKSKKKNICELTLECIQKLKHSTTSKYISKLTINMKNYKKEVEQIFYQQSLQAPNLKGSKSNQNLKMISKNLSRKKLVK